MAQMALATKKRNTQTQAQGRAHGTNGPSNQNTETHKHKHKVEHMVHSTWQQGSSVAEHVSDNIDQTRAVHMLGMCFSHEYIGFGEGCV